MKGINDINAQDVLLALGKVHSTISVHPGRIQTKDAFDTATPKQYFSLAIREMGIVGQPDQNKPLYKWDQQYVLSLELADEVIYRMRALYATKIQLNKIKRIESKAAKNVPKSPESVPKSPESVPKFLETVSDVPEIELADESPELVNHPAHYNAFSVETIEMMRRIWGDDAVCLWCEMTEFKYTQRLGLKDDPSQELAKIQFYRNYRNSLMK